MTPHDATPHVVETPAQLIDGRAVAKRYLDATARKVAQITQATGVVPALATILVGDDPASATYVRMKHKRCGEIGMRSVLVNLPANISTAQLVNEIHRLGENPAIHGILLQHPVPGSVDRRAAFEAIPLAKDVDGVTSAALGRTILGMPTWAPCTPKGIMHLLREYQVPLDGIEAMVVGRSPILGRPMASMLSNAHAPVTLCHSRTRDLPSILKFADVLIAAVGKPHYIQGEWLKPGAVVIDAGYNEGNIGDVDFEAAAKRARLITPVPGGVGPMTIAVLLDQTADAAAQQLGVNVSSPAAS